MSSTWELVQEEQDTIATKYYWVALATVLYFDYLLTLPDEVRYVWQGKKSWMFAIFILSRYLPMAYFIWGIVANLSWVYIDDSNDLRDDKIVFAEIVFGVWCTLVAQIILDTRVYAFTMKNKVITGFFVCITVSQFILGVCMTVSVIETPAIVGHTRRSFSVYIAAYRLCTEEGNWGIAIAYTAVALCYGPPPPMVPPQPIDIVTDILMFLVVVSLVVSRALNGFRMSHILRTIVQDTTLYFLMIFTSHVVFEISLLLVRPSLRLLPGLGSYVLPPIMIGRLTLSLRKAAGKPGVEWSLAGVGGASDLEHGRHTPTHPAQEMQLASVPGEEGPSPARGDIPLRIIAKHSSITERTDNSSHTSETQ